SMRVTGSPGVISMMPKTMMLTPNSTGMIIRMRLIMNWSIVREGFLRLTACGGRHLRPASTCFQNGILNRFAVAGSVLADVVQAVVACRVCGEAGDVVTDAVLFRLDDQEDPRSVVLDDFLRLGVQFDAFVFVGGDAGGVQQLVDTLVRVEAA